MASKPKQIFWLLAVALAIERFDEAQKANKLADIGPEELTGPVLFKDVVEFYSSHSADQIAARAAPVLRHFDKSDYSFGKLTILTLRRYAVSDKLRDLAHQIFRRKMARERAVLNEMAVEKNFKDSFIVNYWSHSWDAI